MLKEEGSGSGSRDDNSDFPGCFSHIYKPNIYKQLVYIDSDCISPKMGLNLISMICYSMKTVSSKRLVFWQNILYKHSRDIQKDYCWSDSHIPVLLKRRTNLISSLGMKGRGIFDITTAGIYTPPHTSAGYEGEHFQYKHSRNITKISASYPGLLTWLEKT